LNPSPVLQCAFHPSCIRAGNSRPCISADSVHRTDYGGGPQFCFPACSCKPPCSVQVDAALACQLLLYQGFCLLLLGIELMLQGGVCLFGSGLLVLVTLC